MTIKTILLQKTNLFKSKYRHALHSSSTECHTTAQVTRKMMSNTGRCHTLIPPHPLSMSKLGDWSQHAPAEINTQPVYRVGQLK